MYFIVKAVLLVIFIITVQGKTCGLVTGKGVRLTYDGQEVNAENLSECPVFVQSTLMNLQYNRNPSEVIKIPPREFVFRKYRISEGFIFRVSQSLRNWGKSDTFLICVSYFLRLKQFLKEKDTGYISGYSIICDLKEIAIYIYMCVFVVFHQ